MMQVAANLLANGTGKKVAQDGVIAGIGVGAPVMAGFGQVETFLAIMVSGLMIVLLALRVYNEWRRARRQNLKDEYYRED